MTIVLLLLALFCNHDMPCTKESSQFDDVASKYSRDITVLDIGEAPVDLIHKNAANYPKSVFVVLGENQEKKELPQNVIWLNHAPTLDDLQRLSLSEHFDVINLHSKISDDFEQVISLCLHMSQHVIVNSAQPYVLENNKSTFAIIKRSLVHPRTILRKFAVHYDYYEKYLVKVRPPYADQKSTWKPGINLMTYLSFNGSYPDRESVNANLPLDFTHLDWMPNNMVLQGEKIVLVDTDDPANRAAVPGTSRLCRAELLRTKQLITQSQHRSV